METSVWLWLYDRRWFFGVKPPSLFKIWALPLFSNAFFFVSLLYYTSSQSDECYSTFKGWIYIRLPMLILTVLGILSIARRTMTSKNKDYPEMKDYKLINPVLIKNYNYWITRKVLISFPGLTLLILGLLNWYWTIHGLNLIYSDYNSTVLGECTSFVHSVVWINLIISGIFSLPMLCVLFCMIIIKVTCILLGVISPSALIKLKKATA